MSTPRQRVTVIYLSLLAAMLLTMFPMPEWAQPLQPDWVALVLIYWCISLPMQIGLATGFIFGLLLDIALGTLFGQHALGLVLISFAVIRIHARLRLFPPIQQGVVIMFILLLQQLIFLWIYGITNRAPENMWLYFLPSFISMVMWPWLFIALHKLQRRTLH